MKKKMLAVLLVIAMILGLTACGNGKDDGGMENEEAKGPASVKSAHGVVEVTPLEGYTVTVSESQEMLTIAPDGSESTSSDYIEIAGPNDVGSIFAETFGYVPGEEYTMDALKADIDADIAERPNVFSNPTEVTVGSYDYMRMDVTINAEASYHYITLVNGIPHVVRVVGGEVLDIDSEDVTTMMESIVFGEYTEEEETEEEEVEEKEAEEKGKIYDGYYSFDVPDGFTLRDEKFQETFDGSDDQQISFIIKSGTVDKEVDFRLGSGTGYEDAGEVTYGDYTWRALTFTWHDLPSVQFIMDVDGGDHYLSIDMYCIAIDSDIAKQVMESLELEEDTYDVFMDYRNEVNN